MACEAWHLGQGVRVEYEPEIRGAGAGKPGTMLRGASGAGRVCSLPARVTQQVRANPRKL